jgi:hypothetical protein
MSRKRYSILYYSTIILLLGNTNPIHNNQAKDYLDIPGPIKYDKIEYNLAWSAMPEKNYIKQEYIPSGHTTDDFNKMILIEALVTNNNVEDIVKIKLMELEKRKKVDPVVNYQSFNKPDKNDYLLDFLVSEGKDNLSMVEWNVYRYKAFKDSSGHQGVMVFGFVSRETKNITDYLDTLSGFRKQQIKILASYPVPKINFKF